jgi:hypothetical protein
MLYQMEIVDQFLQEFVAAIFIIIIIIPTSGMRKKKRED